MYRGGTLLQHIESPVNHEAGKDVRIAHNVDLDPGSKLGKIIVPHPSGKDVSVAVNSSHHQSAEVIGDGLRIVARCPQDGIIEGFRGYCSRSFRGRRAMAPGTFGRR